MHTYAEIYLEYIDTADMYMLRGNTAGLQDIFRGATADCRGILTAEEIYVLQRCLVIRRS